jgi:hypothetical protein
MERNNTNSKVKGEKTEVLKGGCGLLLLFLFLIL